MLRASPLRATPTPLSAPTCTLRPLTMLQKEMVPAWSITHACPTLCSLMSFVPPLISHPQMLFSSSNAARGETTVQCRSCSSIVDGTTLPGTVLRCRGSAPTPLGMDLARKTPIEQWDRDLVAFGVEYGHRRADFVTECEGRAEERFEEQIAHFKTGKFDVMYDELKATMRAAAGRHFVRHAQTPFGSPRTLAICSISAGFCAQLFLAAEGPKLWKNGSAFTTECVDSDARIGNGTGRVLPRRCTKLGSTGAWWCAGGWRDFSPAVGWDRVVGAIIGHLSPHRPSPSGSTF